MARLLGVAVAVVVGFSGCGRSEPPWASGGEKPGWYSLPDEPSNVVAGQAQLRLVNGALQGELALSDGLTRPMYFAVKWQGAEPQRISEVIDPAVSTSFTGAPVVAPPAVRVPDAANSSCFTAEGNLLAYALRGDATAPDPALDELIGVAFKPGWLFGNAYGQRLIWKSCEVGEGWLPPMSLQHDPRLTMALCDDATEPADVVCGQPSLDRTRINSVHLTVEDGRVSLGPSFVARVGGRVTYVVNGVSFEVTAGQLETSLSVGPWRAGRNKIEIRQGARDPWTAEVVLPVHPLHPQLHEAGLREGDAFTVSWDEAPWAQGYSLDSSRRRARSPGG